MTLWDEIELRRFDPETMRGRKNQHRRLAALALLLGEPISSEFVDYLRKVKLARLFDNGGRPPHSAWRIVVRHPGFRYEPEDYWCQGGECGHADPEARRRWLDWVERGVG